MEGSRTGGVRSTARYCIRFSRVFTSAVSSAMVCLVRLASDRFKGDHTGSAVPSLT
jgi:hypothetical protein